MSAFPLRGPRMIDGCTTDGRARRWVLVCVAVMVSACSLDTGQDGVSPDSRSTGFPALVAPASPHGVRLLL